jgi:hypothetical protein
VFVAVRTCSTFITGRNESGEQQTADMPAAREQRSEFPAGDKNKQNCNKYPRTSTRSDNTNCFIGSMSLRKDEEQLRKDIEERIGNKTQRRWIRLDDDEYSNGYDNLIMDARYNQWTFLPLNTSAPTSQNGIDAYETICNTCLPYRLRGGVRRSR